MAKKRVIKAKSKAGKLDAMKFALAGGIAAAICVIFTTIAGIYGKFPMYNLIMLDLYGALGYSMTWTGVIFGAIYGFIDGFVFVGIFALIYNRLLR